MKSVTWMIGASTLSGLAALALLGPSAGPAVLFGMIGPLAIAIATWVLVERTYRASPERLTSMLVAGFAGKMVFFGAYVTVMLKLLSLPPLPFIVSFTGYFIALHLTEAMHLRSLIAAGARVPRL